MEDDSILQVIITIAAVIAVVLSFYNLYVYYRDKKPRIRVKYSSSILGTPGLGVASPLLFTITAMNIGLQPVNLSSCGILLPDNTKLQFVSEDEHTFKTLPKQLLAGESVDISREYAYLARQLKNAGFSGKITVKGFFQDQVGDRYEGKKNQFNIDQWLA
jgi:hypothetical protein